MGGEDGSHHLEKRFENPNAAARAVETLHSPSILQLYIIQYYMFN